MPVEVKNPVDRDPVVLGRQQEGQLLGVVTPGARVFVALFDGVLMDKLWAWTEENVLVRGGTSLFIKL